MMHIIEKIVRSVHNVKSNKKPFFEHFQKFQNSDVKKILNYYNINKNSLMYDLSWVDRIKRGFEVTEISFYIFNNLYETDINKWNFNGDQSN